jgi:DNA-binding beta-propeller fold protein YncE
VDPNTGAQTLVSQGQNFVQPSGVAFAKDGRILVSDTRAFQGGGGGLIAVNPANGLQTRVMGSTLFRRPFGMAVQADGQVLVACLEQAVIRVNPANGDFVNAIPSVRFDMPAGVALDAAGNIIVADVDTSGEDSRLFRIDTGVGASIRAHGEPPGAIYGAVAIEPSGTSSSPASRTTHRRRCYVSLRRAER